MNYAGLFEIYYARLGSDEFVALPKHRKIGAFETFFDIADKVAVLCPTVIKAMRDKHDSVKSLDAESDRLIKDLRKKENVQRAAADPKDEKEPASE